jgi:ketosteroid isomerase-like protein
MTDATREIETLERAFWQSMVDNDPTVATGLLAERALMVSGHGAMSFDHAGYTRMANDPSHKLLAFDLRDLEVLFPSNDVAIATYKVDQQVEYDGKPQTMQAVDSSTWVRGADGWKCAAHTESLQPPKAS